MLGKRQIPSRGPRLGLLLLLALIALACVPVLAQAEGSSGVVYNPKLPSAEGHGGGGHEQIAKTSTEKGGGTNAAPVEEAPAPAPPASEVSSGGVPSGEGGGTAQGGHERSQGSQEGGNGNGGKPVTPKPAPAAPSGGGGSSPLLPILIAIAALAAISVGALLVRQRRNRSGHDGGRPLSTPSKAG
jgi:hypothetical protein